MTREDAIKKVRWGLLGLIIDKDVRDAFETLIPELAESENERIINAIIHYILYETKGNISESTEHVWVTWLEKQKKSLHISETCKENADSFTDEQKEQKPAEWSEEDENTINLMIAILRENHPDGLFKTNPVGTTCMSAISTDMLIKKIESLRPQPKNEWGEEDERIIDTIVSVLGQYIDYKAVSGTGSGYATPRYSKEMGWLRSLRPSWKPSEDEERLINTSISFLRDFADKGYENAVECIDWLKSKLNGKSCK